MNQAKVAPRRLHSARIERERQMKRILKEGEKMHRHYCETINGLPFLQRLNFAWATLRGKLQ